MGAKEDWRTELNFKKVQGVQEEEDAVCEEHKKQNEEKLTGQTEQKELLEEPKKMEIHSMPTEHIEQTVIAEEQPDHVETRITGEEERQLKETRESKVLLEQTEERNMETEQTKDQTVERKQGEELDKSKHLEIEEKDTNKVTEKQVAESEHIAIVEENHTEIQNDEDVDQNTEVETQESVYPSEETVIQADIKPEKSAGTEIVQQTEVETVRTSPDSETDSKIEAPTVKDPTTETETQQQQQEVITETDRISQGDASDGKYHSSESLAETDMKEESYTQTETDERAQTQEQVEEDAATQECEAEIVQAHLEHVDSQTGTGTSIQGSPECIPTKEGTDIAADTDVETPVANDTVVESSEASEKECDVVASEATQEEKDLTANSDADQTPTETETTDFLASASIQAEAETLTTAKPDGKASSIETSEGPAPEEPTNQVTVKEEESTGTVEVNTVGENDGFISCEPTDSPNTDNKQQVQHKDSHLVKPDNSGLTQAAGQRSSRSSGDFCLRKPSNSRGSRLARRLSEDLFTMPEKTSQSQSTCNLQEVKHSEAQSSSLPAEVTERTAVQQEKPPSDPPKRFGLFRRLRGEQQPKEPKGTPKMQVPKILIQDFSDGTGMGKLVEEKVEEKLSSRERRRRRRDRERREKEEERLRNKREKELGKEKERERRKPQMRGKSFQVQGEKGSSDVTQPAKTGSQTLRYSASHAESYF